MFNSSSRWQFVSRVHEPCEFTSDGGPLPSISYPTIGRRVLLTDIDPGMSPGLFNRLAADTGLPAIEGPTGLHAAAPPLAILGPSPLADGELTEEDDDDDDDDPLAPSPQQEGRRWHARTATDRAGAGPRIVGGSVRVEAAPPRDRSRTPAPQTVEEWQLRQQLEQQSRKIAAQQQQLADRKQQRQLQRRLLAEQQQQQQQQQQHRLMQQQFEAERTSADPACEF